MRPHPSLRGRATFPVRGEGQEKEMPGGGCIRLRAVITFEKLPREHCYYNSRCSACQGR